MQSIHDTIYDALTTAPPVGGGQPIESRRDNFFCLCFPGLPIDVTQFADPWTPTNPQGSVASAENFSTLVDVIPSISTLFYPSAASIEQVYQQVVNASVSPTPSDPEARAAFEQAFNFLTTDGIDYNDQGQQVTVKVESPVYRNYKNKLNAYSAAVATYMSNYLQYDLSNPQDQRKWALLGPALQVGVDTAWSDLQAAQRGRVEAAIATMGQYEASSIAGIFANARRNFELTRRGSISQPGLYWHWCEPYPGNWFTPSAADNFSHITIESNRLYRNEHSQFSRYSGGGGAGWGLWRVRANSGGSWSSYDSSNETSNMRISFKFGRVEVRRRWLDPTLFRMRGWRIAGRAAGGLSTGQLDQNEGDFPLLPTTFIVARDIQISGQWGSSDYHYATSTTSHGASVGWGPFRCSGSYERTSSTRTFASSFDGTTISVPGIQIIGFLNRVIPYSPPDAGYSLGERRSPNPYWGSYQTPRKP